MSELAAKKCRAKRRYASERRAEVAAAKSQRTYHVPMRAYECEFCKGWHVGNVYPANSSETRRLAAKGGESRAS